MRLSDALERLEAPEELARAIARADFELDEAWDACARGDHRVWLAACGGAAIEALIEAAATAVLIVLERMGDAPPALADAVEQAVCGGPAELARAAERCEQIADGARAGYRVAPAPRLARIASAAALVVRAAEGLAEGEARREAVRLERARATGALLGGGMHAFLPAGEGPARIYVQRLGDDPAQGAFVFAVAACAEAVAEAVAALEASRDPFGAADLDAIVRGVLEDEA